MDAIEVEESLGLSVCRRQNLVIERGEGNYVWDEQGRAYLDFTAGWGVTCLGHAHPVIIEALSRQSRKIIQNSNSGFTYSPARSALLLKMQQVLPAGLKRLFFANSGAEANDAALKIARKATGRSEVVAAARSFHGRTLSTLSVSGGPENGRRFLPVVPSNRFVDYGDCAALEAVISHNTAAVILEPVQGEGGVRVPPKGYLQFVRNLCDRNGTLLIIDEIQTGFCRTGTFFAIDREDVAPDILTMGKGIAGGLAFAGFALTEQVAATVEKGDHGGTYCGNPLMCAVSEAVISYLLEHDVAAHVASMGKRAMTRLQQLADAYPGIIRSVRGCGLLLALDLGDEELVSQLTDACLRQGLLITPTRGGIVRLLPGLLLTESELAEGIQRLTMALDTLSSVH